MREAALYTAVSACALCVDFAILFMLVHYFSWWYLAAATVSFSFGVLVAYMLSITVVFKERRVMDRRLEFAAFASIGAVGIGINATVMWLLVRYLGLYYLIAKCGAAGVTFMWNFLSRRQLLFVARTPH
jgi:putative flippase GtrA